MKIGLICLSLILGIFLISSVSATSVVLNASGTENLKDTQFSWSPSPFFPLGVWDNSSTNYGTSNTFWIAKNRNSNSVYFNETSSYLVTFNLSKINWSNYGNLISAYLNLSATSRRSNPFTFNISIYESSDTGWNETYVTYDNYIDASSSIDTCDSTTDWVTTFGVISLNTTEKQEGSGALNLYKTQTGNALADLQKANMDKKNFTGKTLQFKVYINNDSTLNNLQELNAIVVQYGSSSVDYYEWHILKSELQAGWNNITWLVSSNATPSGTPDISSCDFISVTNYYIGFEKTSVAGDIIYDDFRLINPLLNQTYTYLSSNVGSYSAMPSWYNWNVTSAVNSSKSKVSFFLNVTSNCEDCGVRFYSKEAGSPNLPSLILNFPGPPVISFSSITTSAGYHNQNYITVNVTSDVGCSYYNISLYNASYSLIDHPSPDTPIVTPCDESSPVNFFVNYTYDDTLPGDGIYYLNASGTTCANYTGYSETRTITLDTTIPLISFLTPNTLPNNTYINASYILMNLNVSDATLLSDSSTISLRVYYSNNTLATSISGSGNDWCATNPCQISQSMTGLKNGSYYYNAQITDSAGNINSTENRTITLDTGLPTPVLNTPANATHLNSSANNFTANLTDNLGIKNATLYVYNQTGLVNSTTVSYGSGILTSTVGIVVTLIDNIYTWFYKVFDWAGNSAISQNRTVYVDINNISLCHPIQSSGTYYLAQNIIATGSCFDIQANNVLFDCNSFYLKGPGGATTSYGIQTNGYNNLTIQNCNITDFGTQINLTNSQNSTIKNVFSKSNTVNNYRGINLQNTVNTNLINITITNISASTVYAIYLTSTNNTKIYNSTIYSNSGTPSKSIFNSGNNDYYTYISNSVLYDLVEYGYHFYLKDSQINSIIMGHVGSTVSRNNTLLNTTTASSWATVSSTTSLFKKWYFNVNVSKSNGDTNREALVQVWDKSGTVIPAGYTTPANGVLSNDLILIEQLVNETNSFFQTPHTVNISYTGFNTNSTQVNLTKTNNTILSVTLQLSDIIPPNVQIVYPTNTTYTINVSELNYTVSDAATCEYSLNNGLTNTSIVCGQNKTGLTSTEGSNTWSVYAKDSLGNLNTSTVTFFKDSIYPLISLGNGIENDGANASRTNIYINTTWTETNFKNITFTYNSSLSYTSTSPIYAYNKTTGLSDGIYYYNVTICDTLNQCNTTATRKITLDTTKPALQIVYPINTNYSNVSAMNYTVSDSLSGLYLCEYSLNNGITNISLTCGTNLTNKISTQGSNTWMVSVEDYAGNKNASYISFFVDYINPNATLLIPINGTQTNVASQNFTANLTDNLGLLNYTLNIYNQTGELVNQTSATTSGLTQVVGVVVTLANGIYNWFFSLFDVVGNSFTSSNNTITIDLISPNVQIVYPQNINYTQVTEINYTVDATATSCWYSLDNGLTNTSITCGQNKTGLTSTEGSNTWKVYAEDAQGNQNVSSVSFIIDSTAPVINIVSPQSKNYGITTIDLNYTVTDGTGVGLSTCWYRNNTDATNITIPCGTNTTISQSAGGPYILYFWANDTLNNVANASVTYSISTDAPDVSLDNPTNNKYFNYTTNIQFNFTATDSGTLDTCQLWGNWSGWHLNQTNSTLVQGTTNFNSLNLPEGIYLWNVWCNNTLGFSSWGSLTNNTFTIDTTYPTIDWGAGTENDGANVSRSNIYINTTWTETNFKNITFRYNSTLETTLTSRFYFRNKTGLSDGIYYYNVTICDLANNCNSTSTRTITLDTHNPNATLLTPSNNTYSNNITQNLTVNITDNLGIKNATLYINGVINSTINFGTGITSSVVGIVVTITDNVYKWFYKIFDWAGNNYSTQNNTITIDTIFPQISYKSTNPIDGANISVNYFTITTNWTETNFKNITFQLYNASHYLNFTYVWTYSSISSTTFFSLANNLYYYNVTLCDLANNCNSTNTRSFTIDTLKPLINFTSPTLESGARSSSNLLINVTYTEINFKNITYKIFNSTAKINETSYTVQPTLFNYSFSYDDIYYYNVTACDYANNCNSTETRNLTRDTVKPIISIINPTNTTYTTRNLLFDVNSTETTNYEYSLDNGVTNTSITDLTMIDFNAGSNVLFVYGTDTAGNIGTANVTFNITYTNLLNVNLSTSPTTPEIGSNLSLVALTTTDNTNVIECNFSLTSPTRVIYNNVKGTESGSTWTSLNYTSINESGTWTYNSTCINEFNAINRTNGSFVVSAYSLTLLTPPNPFSFVAKIIKTELKNITFQLYDNTASTINYTVTIQIQNSSNFTINYPASFVLNGADSSTAPKTFYVTFQGSSDVATGIYYGNVTLNNTFLNTQTLIPFTYGVNPPSAIPRLFDSTQTACVGIQGGACHINQAGLTQGQTTTYTYYMAKTGNYNLASNCSIKVSGDLNQSWIAVSPLAVFDLDQNILSNPLTITLSPTTLTTATTYRGLIYIHCNQTDSLGNPSDSDNQIRADITINSKGGGGGDTGGGGGGGPEAPLNISNLTQQITRCIKGNGICENGKDGTSDCGEDYYNTPEDCQGNLEPITDCFNGGPNCILKQGTAILWIGGFILLILLITSLLEKRKKGGRQIAYLPTIKLKR